MGIEAKVVSNAIPIKNCIDLAFRVAMAADGKQSAIKTLVISGHGGKTWFSVGEDWVSQGSGFLSQLYPIGHYVARDGEVIINACEVGQAQGLLKDLSTMWGGIKVSAWTGTINVWQFWFMSGMIRNGDRIECVRSRCGIAPVDASRYYESNLGGHM